MIGEASTDAPPPLEPRRAAAWAVWWMVGPVLALLPAAAVAEVLGGAHAPGGVTAAAFALGWAAAFAGVQAAILSRGRLGGSLVLRWVLPTIVGMALAAALLWTTTRPRTAFVEALCGAPALFAAAVGLCLCLPQAVALHLARAGGLRWAVQGVVSAFVVGATRLVSYDLAVVLFELAGVAQALVLGGFLAERAAPP